MSAALNTKICEMFGVKYPIIQTAMGWVSTPELTAATANAGGMGFLAAATIKPEEVGKQILRVRELTDQPFGVNFLMEAPGADIIVDSILKHGVRAASYSRSPNPEFIKRFKEAGVLCVPTVGAPRHAEKAVQLGADIIVCQGGEGGGHTGTIASTILLPAVLDIVDVPVVAAGGFKDGRGLVAALAYGASGIAMGTRFLLTEESPVPPATAERYLNANVKNNAEQIKVTTQVDGMPQRCVVNELVHELENASTVGLLLQSLKSALEYRKISGAGLFEILSSAMKMRKSNGLTLSQTIMGANALAMVKAAMIDGDPIHGVLPSGVVAGLIDDLPSVEELIQSIMREAEERLAALSA
ncbi:MAG: nitronate monooxygenase [Deltaproteobacteria bacterium]|nr:nitronate monooxygenase [Deltaproteobacteria bacterium]